MPRMGIVPELFVVVDDDQFILYAPLKGIVASVNQATINWLARFKRGGPERVVESEPIYQRLADLGVLEKVGTTRLPARRVEESFRPTDLVIMATTECNFRCRYCYASAGTYHKEFNLDAAKAAIRLAVSNAIELRRESCHLAFHGGGEPTVVFPFLQSCVAYAREVAQGKVEVLPGITTNGYVNDQQLTWLGNNMHSIQISLDGPAWIHDEQRPLANGKPSFDRVFQTAKYLEHKVPDVIIKATITNRHASDMPAMARFFCENLAVSRFHFGPVMEAGYSRKTGYGEPDPMAFVESALEAQAVAQSYGRQVVVSLAQKTFPHIRPSFCGLTDPNFAITVEGRVSACYEVLYDSDPRAELFHYGQYVEATDGFVFDHAKISLLQQRVVGNLKRCENCFAKWACGGDCQMRHYGPASGQEIVKQDDFRCIVNRELVRRRLVEALEGRDVARFDVDVDTAAGVE